MAAEFPRVQVKGLQRRAGAKVGWDLLAAKSFLFSNHSSGGDAAFDMFVNHTVLETYFRNTAEHGAENCVDKDRVRE
jgi:hypothetical protein